MDLKVTYNGRKVLDALERFDRQVGEVLSGSDLLKLTDIASGTLYPTLKRLAAQGLVQATQEQGEPSVLKRPLRKYYTLTESGRKLVEWFGEQR